MFLQKQTNGPCWPCGRWGIWYPSEAWFLTINYRYHSTCDPRTLLWLTDIVYTPGLREKVTYTTWDLCIWKHQGLNVGCRPFGMHSTRSPPPPITALPPYILGWRPNYLFRQSYCLLLQNSFRARSPLQIPGCPGDTLSSKEFYRGQEIKIPLFNISLQLFCWSQKNPPNPSPPHPPPLTRILQKYIYIHIEQSQTPWQRFGWLLDWATPQAACISFVFCPDSSNNTNLL